MIGLLLAALLSLPASAGEFNSSCFLGLNDADTPATIGDCEAQAMLNTESNLRGTAILKRKGYSKTAALTIATAPVNGAHSFIDSSGNRKDIVCQDTRCLASTNGNAFSAFLTTAAAGITRWSWVDVGGVAYGANNRYDKIVKYDGTTRSSPPGMPLGSILELTPDRLVIGDISGSPNRVHYSSAGAYEQFTTGLNPEDSYFDEVGAPGDKIRGLRHQNGVLHIFKTSSITDCELGDQYTTRCAVISPNLGTTDPASIITAGSSLYFRAQDKNYWELGPGGFRQISQKIPNLVKSQSGGLGGGEASNTQTTQADWQNGTQSPTGTWDTATSPGSIFPSSATVLDTSGIDWASGTLVNVSTREVSGQLTLMRDTFSFTNGNFELGNDTNWTTSGVMVINQSISNLLAPCSGDSSASSSYNILIGGCRGNLFHQFTFSVLDADNNTIKSCPIVYLCDFSGSCGYVSDGCDYSETEGTVNTGRFGIDSSTLTIQSMRIKVYEATSGAYIISAASAPARRAEIRIHGNAGGISCTAPDASAPGIDTCGAKNFMSSGSRISPIFNTTFSTPIGGPFTVNQSSNTEATASYEIQDSADGASFSSLASITPGNRITNIRQYWRYKQSLATSISSKTAQISDVTLTAATTGQFTTQCIQPNASISAWGTLSCAETLAGNGSIVYYATSAATCANLPSTDPGSWQTSITNNATVSIDTNTAVKIGWRSLLTSATDQAQIDACTLAWTEGTPVQPSWAVYDSIKNAIYWTATIDGASYANRLLKFDLNLGYWYPFDIQAQAPKMINNSMYFGGATAGTWNRYGLVDSDDGAGIDAYWKSKDMGADSPFVEKDFLRMSVLSRNNQSGSMTATWTNSIGATGDYTISLSTGAGSNYARSNFNLPRKSPQQFMNIRLGNTNSTPFEILGLGLSWAEQPWKVAP